MLGLQRGEHQVVELQQEEFEVEAVAVEPQREEFEVEEVAAELQQEGFEVEEVAAELQQEEFEVEEVAVKLLREGPGEEPSGVLQYQEHLPFQPIHHCSLQLVLLNLQMRLLISG